MHSLFTKLISGLTRWLYWPICRAYARHILGDKPADPVMRFLCSLQFWKVYRFWPDFITPRRFSEKLWSRMLHERDPIFTLISDKLRVRDYVAEKVGGNHLIPMLWHGAKPGEIPFDDLPLQFVIKANHGCGYNIIVTDVSNINRSKIIMRLEKWLSENFCQNEFLGIAWGYKNIRPAIIIESFIGENDKPPLDYKFYCFSGRVEIVTVHFDRYKEHKTKAFHRDLTPYKFGPDFKQYNGQFQIPPNMDKMISLAELLAAGFDLIRVDLYSQGSNIYFGELTPYPAGVSSFSGFDINSLDGTLGEKWKKIIK